MERGEFIRQLEDAIQQSAMRMEQAILREDMVRFKRAAEAWKQAQLLWLQVAQGMSPEKAGAAMVSFALAGDLNRWMAERRPVPPPSILSLYKEKESE